MHVPLRSAFAALLLAVCAAGSAAAQTLDGTDGAAGAGTLGGTGGLTGSTAGEMVYSGGLSSPDAFAYDTGRANSPGAVASGRTGPDMAATVENSVGQGVQPAGAPGPGAAPAPAAPTPWPQPSPP